MRRFHPLTGAPGSARRPVWSARTLRGVLGLLVAIALIAWQFAAAGPALAGAGDLDPSFGQSGIAITDFANSNDQAFALVSQADGKLVAAGSASKPNLPNSSPADFGLTRYTRSGSLDSSFGTGGKVTTDFGYGDSLYALVVQADGKLVAAGRAGAFNGSGDFALARYNPDGTLDTTFGTGGKATTDFLGDDGAVALALQADGKLVAAGSTRDSSGAVSVVLARYNSDGTLDLAFGTGGAVIGGTAMSVRALVVQTDGKLVAAGSAGGWPYADFALARYNTDGTLDTSFGTGGTVTTDFAGRDDAANALIVQTDDRLVAAGFTRDSSSMGVSNFALARYNTDGTLDTSFGTGGTVTTDFAGRSALANALAVQNGRLVAAGSVTVESSLYGLDFALARYNPDGTLDTSFGTGGEVTTDITGDYFYARDQATALAVQENGKLVAAGIASFNVKLGINDFGLVRYRSD